MKKIDNNQSGFSHFEAVLLLLIVAALAAVGVYVAKNHNNQVSAAPTMPPNATLMDGQLWLVKDNDLAVIGGFGSYEWIGCGITTGSPPNAPNYPACQAGQTPIFTSEATFEADINNPVKIPPGTTYVIYDNEGWSLTPATEHSNAALYEQKFVLLAHAHGLKVIETPSDPKVKKMVNEEVAAAQAGADVIDLQFQAEVGAPKNYAKGVSQAVNRIRKANPNVLILAGLATDPNGSPVSATSIEKSYLDAKGYVNGFWLNADVRPNGKGCSPKGCPVAADEFLNSIGISTLFH